MDRALTLAALSQHESGADLTCPNGDNAHNHRMSKHTPPEPRFWAKVLKLDSGCWEWQAARLNGYGVFHPRHGQTCGAHRFSFELENGAIPNGLHVLHKCDNPPCVNPTHLFLGTQQDNNADCRKKGRFRVGARKRGEAHKWATTKVHQVLAARRLRVEGLSYSQIAKELGLRRAHVIKLVKRQSWAHIP